MSTDDDPAREEFARVLLGKIGVVGIVDSAVGEFEVSSDRVGGPIALDERSLRQGNIESGSRARAYISRPV